MIRIFICYALLLSAAWSVSSAAPFSRVAGILEKNCLECHSGGTARNGLDLTTEASLKSGGDEGPAVMAGDPAQSLLIQKITGQNPPAMPHKRDRLPDADIAVLEEWVKNGARYDHSLTFKQPEGEKWWSLKPLERPPVPSVRQTRWSRTPIDRFVLAALEKQRMTPSPPAEKTTWLRRVSFDLIGLPPTPEEVTEYLNDHSPQAEDRVVDRLLRSPRYGERWARHWLDLVHYADTHGNDQDRIRTNSWPYRDYLVAAFNGDKPYGRFIQEQVAGDIIFPDDPWAIVATGFLAAGPWDESSQRDIQDDTIDKKAAKDLDRDDMVATTMSTFISSTVHCARCHNHKFDPISQKDYYNLQAVFAGIDRAERPFDPDPAVHGQRQRWLQKRLALTRREPALVAELLSPSFQAEVEQWLETLGSAIDWTVLEPVTFQSDPTIQWATLPDHSLLASGALPAADTLTASFRTTLTNITALRLEALAHDSLPQRGPGRQSNGNFALTEITATLSAPGGTPEQALTLINPSADFNQAGWTIAMALDGNQGTGWSIFPNVGKDHHAVFELKEPAGFAGGGILQIKLDQKFGAHLMGRVRLSATTHPHPVRASGLPASVTEILRKKKHERSREEQIELASFYLSEKIDRELSRLPPASVVYAAAADFKPDGNFKPAGTPREVHVLRRGEITKPLGLAKPAALPLLPNLRADFDLKNINDEGERRAALAQWLSARENALTWRSMANRLWHYHFGRGLVDTPNDFGRLGSTPTHPELLDWLAAELRDNGGSVKKIHRLIVLSAAYRQSTRNRPEYAARDAENQWLWRMNRTRLEAEALRDAVLHISGKLDTTMGGPGAKLFSEKPGIHVTPEIEYAGFDMDRREANRRSVYRFIFRTLPDPFMDNMDCPDASQLTPARNVSVTPLQALSMMNNPFMVRQSQHFAARLTRERHTIADQIKRAYELALGRQPRKDEMNELLPFAEKHGLANVCRVIFNSNEFVFVD